MIKEKYANEIEVLLSRYPDTLSAVLPLMHLAQNEYGYMSKDAMREVADILDIDPTHVLMLSGFYTLYHEDKGGKYKLEVCYDLACALRGADEFLEMACNKLGIEPHGTTDDGMFTVIPVMCLGACDKAPMLQCNLKFEELLDEAKFDELIDRLRKEDADGSGGPTVVEKIAAYYK